jgi:hypothetical protein
LLSSVLRLLLLTHGLSRVLTFTKQTFFLLTMQIGKYVSAY